jgi:hypothetical protein
MAKTAVGVLESNGMNEARAYVIVVVYPAQPEPILEHERVQIVDPRATSTVRSGAPCPSAGPRNPDQRVWPAAKAPGIELPDGLPATKAQRVRIDPELMAQWRAEAAAAAKESA